MDFDMTELAAELASNLITTLGTAAWKKAKVGIGALWRRVHPDRAETVEAEATEAHEQLVAARDAGDGQVEQDLVAAWRSRVRALLAADPNLAEDVRALARELQPAPSAQRDTSIGSASMEANVFDHGRAYQALGDQNITEG